MSAAPTHRDFVPHPTAEYVRYRIDPAQTEAFEAAYAKASASLEADPYCLHYVLRRCVEEPDRYILQIDWTSQEDHLQGFRKGPHFAAFLAAIKPYISAIEEMQHYDDTAVRTRPSIYEDVGGVATFFRIAKTMHEAMVEDDLLGSWFANSPPSHVPHLAMWLCEVFGGPKLWTDTLGDIGHMLSKHAGLDIPEDKRARFEKIAREAATAVIGEGHDAAIEAIASYFEWGTKIAVVNSKPDHVPDAGAGVPTWEWPSSSSDAARSTAGSPTSTNGSNA